MGIIILSIEGLAKPIKAIGIGSQNGQERKIICPEMIK
jgi:hypothetical protein